MGKINKFDLEHKTKILSRYNKYYNSDRNVFIMPTIEVKNMISESWDLSKILNKHKKLDSDDVFKNIKLNLLKNISKNYHAMSPKDFALYLTKYIKELEE